MAEHRFVEPIEKGLLTEYGVRVDAKATVPASDCAHDSISKKTAGSWWYKVIDIPAKGITVFECDESISSDLCSELCLLKCSDRCCMNWTTYDETDCIQSDRTSCNRLHQLSLYTHTLGELGKNMSRLTDWPVHFIICESLNSTIKEAMHLNRLGSMVDTFNVLVLNPNPFPFTIILHEKSRVKSDSGPKKRGRKMLNRMVGTCQMSINVEPCKVLCITNDTLKHWDVYSVTSSCSNYMVCILGRYDLNNWLIKRILQGKDRDRFTRTGGM